MPRKKPNIRASMENFTDYLQSRLNEAKNNFDRAIPAGYNKGYFEGRVDAFSLCKDMIEQILERGEFPWN
jgi:hypothetical protein